MDGKCSAGVSMDAGNGQKREEAPLPPGLPHIAYVLLWYPLFTQPFIFREVEELRRELPLDVYTLYNRNTRCCSREMLDCPGARRVFGARALPGIFAETMRQIFMRPRDVAKLFRRNVCRRWTSLETFGENLWAFFVGIRLARHFKEDGIDMVYAPWPRGAATAGRVAAHLSGLPFATSARGDNLEPADPDLADKFDEALFVRANNAADRERIESFGRGEAAGKTELVYNSLTLPVPSGERLTKRFEGEKLRILALGRFDVTKGFDVLLRACANLRALGQDFSLTLAGGGGRIMGLGSLDKSLRALRAELGLENEVSMPGLVSHDDLPRILASHDVFAAPCVVHSSGRRDGIPNTVIEALASGLPVVGTDVNALPEVVRHGETGLLVPQGDADALADALAWIARHPADAARMGQNGVRLARSLFDPSANARRFAEIFCRRHAGCRG